MRRVLTVTLIAMIAAPAVARARSFTDAADGQSRQYPPVTLPPSPYPPQLRLAPAPPPLNEAEWGRWLLRSREQGSRCNKIAAITGGLAAVPPIVIHLPDDAWARAIAIRATQSREVIAAGTGVPKPRRRPSNSSSRTICRE